MTRREPQNGCAQHFEQLQSGAIAPERNEMTLQAQSSGDIAALPSSRAALDFQRDIVALIPFLRAFSRSLCGKPDIAEDMAQEALARAWRARDRFEPGTNLKAWLFTILRHEFYSHMRRAWREAQWDEVLGNCIPAPPREQESAMNLADTARALSALPERQRAAVILVGAGGHSYAAAAGICGTAVSNMKSRVARGRAALSKSLDGGKALAPRSARCAPAGFEDILAQLTSLAPASAILNRHA